MKKCNGKGCMGTKIAWILVIIGALNWLLIGVFNWNLVDAIFGNLAWLERLIYILVGLSGIMLLSQCPCSTCKGKEACGSQCDTPESSPSESVEEMMEESMDDMEEAESDEIEG